MSGLGFGGMCAVAIAIASGIWSRSGASDGRRESGSLL
jgi:hypothetical protein